MPEVEGEVQYKIQEIVAPDGYVLNSSEQIIKLNFAKIEGVMTLTGAVTVDPISTVGDIINNNLSINFKNEEKVPEIQTEDFTLSVNKIDKKSGNLIKNNTAIFQVLNSNGTSVGLFETDNNGTAKIKLKLPKTAGTIEYKLVEKVAPRGYILDESEKIVTITFVENNGIIGVGDIQVAGINVKKGTTTLTSANMSFENEVIPQADEPEEKTCTIELQKVNSETLQTIAQAGVIFKVRTQDGKESYLATDANGKITLSYIMPQEAGNSRIEIQEIKAPNGYKLYDTVQYLDLTFGEVDGEMVITDTQVSGSKITVTHGTEKATASILNDKEETIVEPDKSTFSLNINKVDSKTLENILQSGVTFKVTGENVNSYVETSQKGIAKINLNVPEKAGTYTYKLSEIIAPNGYTRNANELLVNVTFTEVEGKLEISNLTVNEEKGIKAVEFNKDTVEVKVLNKEAKPTDPSNPKDPTNPSNPNKPTQPTKPNNSGNNTDGKLSGLLPKTGESMTIVILMAVAILTSVYYFIKMKKLKKKNNKNIY